MDVHRMIGPHLAAASAMALLAVAIVAAMGANRTCAAAQVEFTKETLANGLEVLYAPLHQAPVIHVRVFYHVGSRDERPDRQGFAHMFEHMMFRGSAHVKPEDHMKLIGMVGGYSNAYTSFDETVYVNTIPSSQLELALYLEADRMASFKVSPEIYQTERKVVTEEWRMRQNQPYGTEFEDFVKNAFTSHPYRWTPIGNMDNLRAAQAAELQEFFNRYYLPGNAVLVIAGDFELKAAQELVHKYYGWIPRGDPVKRDIAAEPQQKEPRRAEVKYRVPLAKVMIGYPTAAFTSDDHYALSLLATILGSGRSSRLDRTLVYSAKPLCLSAEASDWQPEDMGMFFVSATVLSGHDPDEVEKALTAAVEEIRAKGVTAEELEKAKVQARLDFVHQRETAADIAGQLATAAMIGGDPNRVNTDLDKFNAVTVDSVKAVAAKYLLPARATTLRVTPDPAAPMPAEKLAEAVASTKPIAARDVKFPEGYPAKPPVSDVPPAPHFEKGTESKEGALVVIVMPDSRLPLVNWSLTMRAGSDNDPPGEAGLATLTASMVRRGAGGLTFEQINADLESRGITIEVSANEDTMRLTGSCTTDQLDYAMRLSRTILRKPTFALDEFQKRKEQLLNQLRLQQENPVSVAQDDLAEALFDSTPLGVHMTPESIGRIRLDEAEQFYRTECLATMPVLVISGDVSVERGQALAKTLLADWAVGILKAVDYKLPKASEKRTILLVDRPEGKQSTVRMGVRAYDLRSDAKYAGDLASRILSSGIDSRLGRYVRAEKGLAYGVRGVFQPGRHSGSFSGVIDTAIPSTADAIEAMFKVFTDMRDHDVSDTELSEAKLRVAGSMVLNMQTIAEQARYRLEGILNDYPIDYYDKYPTRISEVTKAAVREVMEKFVRPDRMAIIVVAPAAAVKEQLGRLGEVQVVPMPAKRKPEPATP
jgi:zinc protease